MKYQASDNVFSKLNMLVKQRMFTDYVTLMVLSEDNSIHTTLCTYIVSVQLLGGHDQSILLPHIHRPWIFKSTFCHFSGQSHTSFYRAHHDL